MKKLILLLLLVSPLQAATRYVAKTGNDTANNCLALGTPCLTIARGINQMVSNDTLLVRTGTYVEVINNTIPAGTDWTTFTRVAAYPGDTVTVQCPAGQGASFGGIFYFEGSAKHHIEIDGFIIDGNGEPLSLVKISRSASPALGAHHIRIQNCEIKRTSIGNGLLFSPTSDYNQVLNNNIHDNGKTTSGPNLYGYCIYMESSFNLFRGNDCYDSGGNGIQVYSGTGAPTDNIIDRNKIHNNTVMSASGGRGAGITSWGTNTTITNNIIYSQYQGLDLRYASGLKIFNNTIYGHTVDGILLSSTQSAQVISNILYSNGSTTTNNGATTSFTTNLCQTGGANCQVFTSTSPFTNAGTGDFTLVNGPAVGAGSNLTSTFGTLGIPAVDYAGTARQTAPTNWDIGAYKYAAGATPTITLNTPNGGENWQQGVMQTISYTVANVANVTIDLDIANDGVYEIPVAASGAATGSFSWTVPNNPSDLCRIKIRDPVSGVQAVSAAVFSIKTLGGATFTTILSENTTGIYAGTAGVQDTYLEQGQPDSNKNGGGSLYANKYAANFHNHSLISFDAALAQVPSGSIITSATLGVYQSANDGGGSSQTVDVRRLLKTPVESQVTWNSYSGISPSLLAWTTPGALNATDRVSATSTQITGFSTTNGWKEVTVTDTSAGTLLDDIRKRKDGTYTIPLWWHLSRSDAGNDSTGRTLTSSEGVNGQRPYLGLNFATAGGTITMTQPVAGSHLYPGQQIGLHWDSSGVSGLINVYVSYNNGTYYQPTAIVADIPYNQADAIWTVDGPSGSGVKFKAVWANNPSVYGESGAVRIAGRYKP